ncbi:conserved hypothetical protein [Cupriavidus taiwanensis]|nr:conserved hypothetical protein [Cupriavidus taiwanensis]
MDDQQLKAHCLSWAHWCRTRKYFAPPVPQNLLSRMQPRSRPGVEVDHEMSQDLPFFNMAIHALADECPEDAMCFSLYYFHGIRPVKVIASALGIGQRTFYDRLNKFSRRAQQASAAIKRVHLEHTAVSKNLDNATVD